MNMKHRFYDPGTHCPACSKIHNCLVINMGHYCPENYTRGSAAASIRSEATEAEKLRLVSSQSKLAFSSSGISTDRKTFKERFQYWKSFLANQ